MIEVCWKFRRCSNFSRSVDSWDTFMMMATATKWPSIDSRNRHHGVLEATNTSLQSAPGLHVVATGSVRLAVTKSLRFRQKTWGAGSSSTSSLGPGPALGPAFVREFRGPGFWFMECTQAGWGEETTPIIGQDHGLDHGPDHSSCDRN